jgi:hypothetical protein
MSLFNPNEHVSKCEEYLTHSLGNDVVYINAELLEKSTRAAPWRLDVEVGGLARSYVLRVEWRGEPWECLVFSTSSSLVNHF